MLRQLKHTFTLTSLYRSPPRDELLNCPSVVYNLGQNLSQLHRSLPFTRNSTAFCRESKYRYFCNIKQADPVVPTEAVLTRRNLTTAEPTKQTSIVGKSPAPKRRKMTSITTVQRGSLNKLDYRIYYRKYLIYSFYDSTVYSKLFHAIKKKPEPNRITSIPI